MKFQNRRHYFSLLEVLISIALTSLLLSTLLWFYRDVVFLGKRLDDTTKELFQNRYVEGRLSDVLYNTVFTNTKEKDFAFYTESLPGQNLSLVVTYDNGVNQNEDFSNHVLGKFYVDQNKSFCLATWPSFKKTNVEDPHEMVREVLLDNVEDVKYSFYIQPNHSKQVNPVEVKLKGEATTPYPPDSWQPDWKREYQCIPAIVKIEIKLKGRDQPLYFAFPMSDKRLKINYSLQG